MKPTKSAITKGSNSGKASGEVPNYRHSSYKLSLIYIPLASSSLNIHFDMFLRRSTISIVTKSIISDSIFWPLNIISADWFFQICFFLFKVLASDEIFNRFKILAKFCRPTIFTDEVPSYLFAECISWRHHSPGCVNSHNLIRYRNKTVEECKRLCITHSQCLSFEYGE